MLTTVISLGPQNFLSPPTTALGTFQGNLDAEEQEHQAWCELPFWQLAYNFNFADTMSSADELVRVYLEIGMAARAQQIGKDLLETKGKYFIKTHPSVAETLNNLGIVHGDLGNYGQKKDLLERALILRVKHYGKEHVG